MDRFVGALDQGTTSTRFIIFDGHGSPVAMDQLEHRQILPQPGWVEHDPVEIGERVETVIRGCLRKAGLAGSRLAAVGVTNQRETSVIWNPRSGKPFCNALVWQDTRSDRIMNRIEASGAGEVIRRKAGLPPATYFSGGKIRWMLDRFPEIGKAAARGEAWFGTMDTWALWNLTGGIDGGVHVTDVTNASRTMLMDLKSRRWDPELLELFDVNERMLPRILSSSHPGSHGVTRATGPFGAEVPITGILGDQQAALMGQACFQKGEAKNTYGTGNFLLLNTATDIVPSTAGLLTTVGCELEGEPPLYALEGSVAVTGAAVQWLRDQLGVIDSAAQVEALANTVPDNGGIYFVPAFSGLFAPYWRADARGAIVGLSRFNNRGHFARAALEAICYQSRDVLEAMVKDLGAPLEVLKVDGGATANDTLMQLQADIVGVPVVRPKNPETTALGAAYAAGLAVGFWQNLEQLRSNWRTDRQFEPRWSEDQRESAYATWKKAVERTFDWVDVS